MSAEGETNQSEARTAGLGELLPRLVDDLQALVRAEIGLYRAELGRRALSAGWALALFGGALVLAQAAVVALLVGLVGWLGPAIGHGWAIAMVVVASMALAALMVRLGIDRIAAMFETDDTA